MVSKKTSNNYVQVQTFSNCSMCDVAIRLLNPITGGGFNMLEIANKYIALDKYLIILDKYINIIFSQAFKNA